MSRRRGNVIRWIVTCALGLFVGGEMLGTASWATAASPVGDEVFVSAYNMPTNFGRPVIVDDSDPFDVKITWDPDNGSGLSSSFGATANLPPLGSGVTVNQQLTVGTRISTWAGSGSINVMTPKNGVVNNTAYTKPGELIQIDFSRTNGQSMSNPATNFDPWGFLIEDVEWRQAGVAETRPIILRSETLFLYFTKNGALAPVPQALQAQLPVGNHPTAEVAQVIYFVDAATDLADPSKFYDAEHTQLFDDGVAFFGVNPDVLTSFPFGLLETLFLVAPINDVHLGLVVSRAQYGDATLDDIVDGADYTVWADNYLLTDQTWQDGDFNNDGVVDGGDYTLWADNYNPNPTLALAATVPEPSTGLLAASALALLGGCAVARRRRV